MSISLASIPFFANLDAGDMMALMSATKTVEVPGNTTIFLSRGRIVQSY
jgi:hypothetical protein